ncbi:MAG: hypothetical protein IT448_04765 [Phycisphaerales bacterium]|nr:hypothetical protein [Phycisphaerales bacterium]
MSTATAPDSAAKQSCTTQHFLLRRVHSLTGLVFGGYLVVHLMINATLAQVGDVYQEQVNKLYSLPFLMGIEWALIFLPIIFHTIYGIWITIKGQPNVNHYGYHRNWQYTLQRMSAMVIVLFLVFHVLGLKYHLFGTSLSFDHHNATASVHRHMMTSVLIPYVIYPIGILASCYHLANGFWGAAITWGLAVSAGAQRRWGYACAILFVITMVFGFVALYYSVNPHTIGAAVPMHNALPIQGG